MTAKYYPELVRILKAAECRFIRNGKGDHEIWHSPITDKHFPVDKGCKRRHTANETLKQAGLPKAF